MSMRLQGGLDEVACELRTEGGERVSCGNFWEEQSRQRVQYMQRPWGRAVWGVLEEQWGGQCSWSSDERERR